MLDLTLKIPSGHSTQAAAMCRAQMTAAQWAELTAFAAAVVLAQEQASTGQVVLVAPVSREALALGGQKALVAARALK